MKYKLLKLLKKIQNSINDDEEIIGEDYNIDDDVMLEVLSIKFALQNKKGIELDVSEVLGFLNEAINFDNFQLWLLETEMSNNVQLSRNAILKNFLNEISENEILTKYDTFQNASKTNKKTLKKVYH